MESWRPVVGYKGKYEVSDSGTVVSLAYGKRRFLKPIVSGNHVVVSLSSNGVSTTTYVYHIVLSAFRQDYTPPSVVNYVDGNIHNVTLSNLVIIQPSTADIETWKDISGYEGYYQVSNIGRVRSCKRAIEVTTSKTTYIRNYAEKLMNLFYDEDGYAEVHLCKDNKTTYHRVHRLVATAFIPNADNLPEVNHIDGDPKNNIIYNLEWCTTRYNIQDAYKRKPNRQRDHDSYLKHSVMCVSTGEEYTSISAAARSVNGTSQVLSQCIKSNKLYKGLKFKFIQNTER